jgi:hypothetical protein
MTTAIPTYNEETGEITGVEIQPQRGGWSSSANDYIQDEETGELHHVFDNVSLESEDEGFNQDSYYTDLANSDPRIIPALSWAGQNLDASIIESYNASLDQGDLDQVYRTLEYILNAYQEDQSLSEIEEEPTDTLTDEAVNTEIESLQQAYPDQELVQEFMAAAVSSDNEAEQTLYYLAAEFHAGRISAEAAIQEAYNRLPEDQLYAAYQLINNY